MQVNFRCSPSIVSLIFGLNRAKSIYSPVIESGGKIFFKTLSFKYLSVLIFLLLCILVVIRYNEKKRNDMISRLTGRNRNTDTNPAVAYSNNSFNDPGFTNEYLYSNARYEVGYGDVVVNEENDVGRNAIKNESYDDNYFDC